MTIFFNDKPIIISENLTVQEFLDSQGFKKNGTGIAVNDIFIRQADWEKRLLKEGDKIVMIQAAYGG